MNTSILLAAYMVGVIVVSWVESKALVGLKLGNSLGGLIYAILSNLICSFVAPVAAVASVVAGFLGVASAINNVRPTLGAFAGNFSGLNEAAVWVLSFAMILGRLEVFTLLVLMTPAFWRE